MNALPRKYISRSVYDGEQYHTLDVGQTLAGKLFNPFLTTFPTFAVRETDASRHNGGTSGAPLKTLRNDSALRALSSLRVLRGAPEVPPLCRETQSLGQQMLNATVGINGLNKEKY